MELRMSLYPGDFLKFIIEWTDQVGPLHELISKKAPDPRMNDVELAVRFLAFSDQNLVYAGDLKKFLDELCTRYNSAFADDENAIEVVRSRLDNLNESIAAGIEIFPENKFCRKFVDGEYERRFNRAIFDVLVGALANPGVRRWALNNSADFVAGFEQVSATDAFRRAVETTTKSVASTRTRFERFYAKVTELTGIQLDQPAIANEIAD